MILQIFEKVTNRFVTYLTQVRQQRSGPVVFDVVVELKPKQLNEWTVIFDVQKAVDKILTGKKYQAQVRRRDPASGEMSVELVQN